jgi:hypothetical protein
VNPSLWPAELNTAAAARKAQGSDDAGTAADKADRDVELTIEGLDPSMQAFLALERRIKKEKKEKKRTEGTAA